MQLEWNLKNLFKNIEEFNNEIKKIKELLNDIKKYCDKKLDSESLFDMLEEKWNIKECTNKVLVYASLMYYKNVNEEKYIELKSIAEKLDNQVNLDLNFVDKKILKMGEKLVKQFIRNNKKLVKYNFSLDNLFRVSKHIPNDDIRKKIKENNDIISDALKSYNKLLQEIKYGEIEVDLKKIEITSSNFAKYVSSIDRETRKQAYLTANRQFEKEEDSFIEILSKIIRCRRENAILEEYDSVLQKVLFEENINPNIIDTLIKSVNDNLHLIQKYLKIKSDILKIDEPHLYDFITKTSDTLNTNYSQTEATLIIKESLKPLKDKYLKTIDYLLDGHVDAILDDKKNQNITFSWNDYSFLNFRGYYGDLKNMTHELGHIVNYHLSKEKLPFIYVDSTVFIGEVASLVNERLLNKYLYDNAKTDEEKMFYLAKEIDNYFVSIFKPTMYTELECILYNMKSCDLTKDRVSEEYFKLIKKYYGDNVIYDKEAMAEWTRLGHQYRWSFYSYKYATGLIIASTLVDSLLYKKSLDVNKYLEFLSLGSSQYPLDLLKLVDIDLTNYDIINKGFRVLEKYVNDYEKLSVKNKKL